MWSNKTTKNATLIGSLITNVSPIINVNFVITRVKCFTISKSQRRIILIFTRIKKKYSCYLPKLNEKNENTAIVIRMHVRKLQPLLYSVTLVLGLYSGVHTHTGVHKAVCEKISWCEFHLNLLLGLSKCFLIPKTSDP